MGAGCVGSFRGFRLGGDEVEESLVVLAPGLGGWGPAGDGGRGTRGRHAGVVVPYGGLRKAPSTTQRGVCGGEGGKEPLRVPGAAGA